MIVAVDTSVIVAALSTWDARYESAARTIERLADENTLIVREAGAEAILTFNARHFWGEGLEVLTP